MPDYTRWHPVSIPKTLWEKIKKEVETKGFWASPSEFVRDAVKAKLNIYNFRFQNSPAISCA